MNGKGSTRRPMKVSQEQFESNWELVFGNNNKRVSIKEFVEGQVDLDEEFMEALNEVTKYSGRK